MKWVTRERPKTDRIACPWLITNFIDPEAEFLYVPADQVSPFGNSLAWSYYEARALLSPEDKAFALEVAERAQAAAKDDTSILDTYACCLSMNGKKDEAIRQVRRCIELEPDKQQWKDRLAELEG